MFSRHKSRLTLGVFSAGFAFLLIWTLGVHLASLSAQPFGTLYVYLGLASVAGALSAFTSLYPYEDVALPNIDVPNWRLSDIDLAHIGAVALLVVVFLVAAGIHYKTSNFLPFWGVSLLVGIAALSAQAKLHSVIPIRFQSQPNVVPRNVDIVFLIVALMAVVFYLFTSIPDSDDSLFLNFAVGAKENRSAIFSEDTMLGLPGLDFIKSTYRLESYQLLAAIISDATGWSVIFIAHTVIPVFICIWVIGVLTLIHNSLFPNHFSFTLVFHLLVLIAMDRSLQSYGYHAIPRLFHGKAPFVTAIVPLISVLSVMSLRNGSWQALWLLCGVIVIAIGFTANAIYAASLCAALIALTYLFTGGKFRWRAFRLLLIVVYPACLAGYLLAFDPPHASEVLDAGSIWGSLWSAFGTLSMKLIALVAIFAALCLPFIHGGLKAISVYTLGFLVCVINPYLWPLYGEYVTGNLNVRLFWAIPIPLIFTIFLGLLWSTKNRVIRGGVVLLLILGMIGPGSILRVVSYGFAPLKVPAFEFSVAERVVETLGPDTLLLAPEDVSAWVTVIEDAPAVVEGREIYTPQRIDPRFNDNLLRRAQLFNAWTTRRDDSTDVQALVDLGNQVDVYALLIDTRRPLHMRSEAIWTADGFNRVWQMGAYRLLVRFQTH